MAAAVRYLLWSDLALCNQKVTKDSVKEDNLMDLYLGRDKEFADRHLKDFFINGSIDVVNPLIYSAISEEIWGILSKYAKEADSYSDMDVFEFIKQKLSNRSTFLKDKNIVVCWVESYIRGSFAILSSTDIPMTTRTFHDPDAREIDIAGDDFNFVLIECGIRDKDKTASEVHFNKAYTGRETCILATKRNCGVVNMNGIEVLKIPYPMLAAFLDRGEVPNPKDFPKV
jgi:hypothetical protein